GFLEIGQGGLWVAGQMSKTPRQPALLVSGWPAHAFSVILLGACLVAELGADAGAQEKQAGWGAVPLQGLGQIVFGFFELPQSLPQQGPVEVGLNQIRAQPKYLIEIGTGQLIISLPEKGQAAVEIGPGEARPQGNARSVTRFRPAIQ